ncbi:MAG: FecR family protein [Mariniphaga sp.]|nr:FecR family protein [Mariniphaga sp.]MDD4227147.1 FecR family protein [Mariniphaga sp.]MDD4424578.1 FecR family protein [Mariniphaga sp.]
MEHNIPWNCIVNYLKGHVKPHEQATVNNWLEEDKSHSIIFSEIEHVYSLTSSVPRFFYPDEEKAWEEIKRQLNKKDKSNKFCSKWAKVAAIFLLAFVSGGIGHYFLSQNSEPIEPPLQVEYVAPLGSRSFLKMPDGSKIWLNAGTTIIYQTTFGSFNRDVKLTGEAFFEIAKNQAIPFVVQTSEINITALGTQFNVKAYADEKTIETTLIKGSVKLESTKFKLAEEVILTGTEKAVYTKQSKEIDRIWNNKTVKEHETAKPTPELKIITSIEPDPIISWKDERWIINNEKLVSLSKKLERRYAVNIIFDNELLKEYSFGGTLEDETLEQVLDAICSSSPIKYVIEGKSVYIMSDKQKLGKFKHLLMR